MTPLVSQILLAFLLVTVGFIFGAVIAVAWAERDRKANPLQPQPLRPRSTPQETPIPDKTGDSVATAPFPDITGDSVAAAPLAEHDPQAEIALLRDPNSGKLAARFDAKLFHSAQELNPAQRQQVVKLTGEWLSWLGLVKEAAPEAKAQVANPTAEAHRPAVSAGLTPLAEAQPLPTPEPPSASTPAAAPSGQNPPPPPPAPSAAAPVRKTGKLELKPGEAKPAPPVSIVGQIDEILQDMLLKAPADFPAVRLVEDLTNGVIVWVGTEHFYGIDAVTDARAREIIKAAVAEWERRADRERR